MFRGGDNVLQPNWLLITIGYHGRSSSISIGGSLSSSGAAAGHNALGGVRHPCSQVMINPANPKKGGKYGPTRSLSFELEVALVVGRCTNIECISGSQGVAGVGAVQQLTSP
jgi:fumarylacetoacetase